MTHVLPKELLPIVTKPSLYLVLEEALQSGLKEIVLVVSPDKKPFFEHLKGVFPKLTFKFVIQEEPKGLGHAILMADQAVGPNPFIILLPDILIDHPKPVCLQLIEVFQKIKKSVNATGHVPKEQVGMYGIYEMESQEGRLHKAKQVVEKPTPKEAPSDMTVTGRYLFTPAIFEILRKTRPGRNEEIQLADAMNTLAGQGELYAYEFEGVHMDIGNPLGLIRANIYFGKKEYGDSIYQGLV